MLSKQLHTQLTQHGITVSGEIELREALEARAGTYTLIKLAPWPARRWKCHYRLLIRDSIYDAQSPSEAYAMAILAILDNAQAG
jgi:hypothetical protein